MEITAEQYEQLRLQYGDNLDMVSLRVERSLNSYLMQRSLRALFT